MGHDINMSALIMSDLALKSKTVAGILDHILRFPFFYLIYFKIGYLTAIIFDETRITIWATNTKKY
jgi:hypothetical protein